jgi:hypothetical protein
MPFHKRFLTLKRNRTTNRQLGSATLNERRNRSGLNLKRKFEIWSYKFISKPRQLAIKHQKGDKS